MWLRGGIGDTNFSTNKRQQTWRGLCTWEGPTGLGSVSERSGVCFSLPSVQGPRGGSQPGTVSLIATVPWDPRTQGPLASRARHSRGIPWDAAAKTGAPDVRTQGIRHA